MTERDANNRKIAEWLEPTPKWSLLSEVRDDGVCWIKSDRGAYQRCYIDGQLDGELHCDFYTDESANAMLLDALPAVELYRHPPELRDVGAWRCRPDWGLDFNVAHPDRKTAICSAFIAWNENP